MLMDWQAVCLFLALTARDLSSRRWPRLSMADLRRIFSRTRCSTHIARCTGSTCSDEGVREQARMAMDAWMTRCEKRATSMLERLHH
jgi:hypothetical protein